MLIEASQLLNHRRTDIDDLVLNTLGTLLGFACFCLFRHVRKQEGETGSLWEPVLYAAALFVCRFFAYNEFGAAKRLFGF